MIEDLRERILEIRRAMEKTDSRLEYRLLSEQERMLLNDLEDAIYDLSISVSVSYNSIKSIKELDTMCIVGEYLASGDINKAVLEVVKDEANNVDISNELKVEIL